MKRAFAILLVPLAGCAAAPSSGPKFFYEDHFANLDHWQIEGMKRGASISPPGTLRLDCDGSQQGAVGVMAFCKQDFPDNVAIEYDLVVEHHNGLLITFLAMQGLHGQDALTGVPPRAGTFDDYTAGNAPTRSYHVSVCRYMDDGSHSGVSNWRRNPGLHLMASGKDLCTETNTPYHIKITKRGRALAIFVNGQPGPSFTDPNTLPDHLPTSGKVGFRAIGSKATFQISNFKVIPLR